MIRRGPGRRLGRRRASGLSGGLFSAAVLMVLATTMITPPLLRLAYPRRRGRAHVAVEEAFTAVPDEVHDAVGTSGHGR